MTKQYLLSGLLLVSIVGCIGAMAPKAEDDVAGQESDTSYGALSDEQLGMMEPAPAPEMAEEKYEDMASRYAEDASDELSGMSKKASSLETTSLGTTSLESTKKVTSDRGGATDEQSEMTESADHENKADVQGVFEAMSREEIDEDFPG